MGFRCFKCSSIHTCARRQSQVGMLSLSTEQQEQLVPALLPPSPPLPCFPCCLCSLFCNKSRSFPPH